MVEYGKQLQSEMTPIASQTFTVRDKQVKFEFKLVQSDMKWLAKFSGELNNAAKYPCFLQMCNLVNYRKGGKA